MAPSVRRAATRVKAETARKPRRTRRKKQLQEPKKIKISSAVEDLASNTTISSSSNACSKSDSCTVDAEFVDVTANACSTPKAQRFRIPEIVTCPPAPKKQRVASNCSLRRKPIAFFVPPDLDLFFFLIPRDIPV